MGVSYRGTCPYCHTEHVQFQAIHSWVIQKGGKRALFKCGFCEESVIREYTFEAGKNAIDIKASSADASAHGIILSSQWPTPGSTDAPPDCPANVSSFFKQAHDSLNNGSFDAAGMMFRKALEASTKALDANSKGKNLAARIKLLVDDHTLTPALGAWANEVRLSGNDAAHDEEPFTKEEAEALYHFAENFLNYAFTMPAAVSRRSSPPMQA